MDNKLKDSDFRDYELYLESLKPTDEELDFWLQDMYKNQINNKDCPSNKLRTRK